MQSDTFVSARSKNVVPFALGSRTVVIKIIGMSENTVVSVGDVAGDNHIIRFLEFNAVENRIFADDSVKLYK